MTIGLNSIRELRKGWIRQDFGPPLEVELGLRNALRHLKGDRHGRRYARKRKNEVHDRASVSDWNCDRAVVGMRRNRGSPSYQRHPQLAGGFLPGEPQEAGKR